MEADKTTTGSLDVIYYSVDDTFVDKIKECLKSIKEMNAILNRYKQTKFDIKINIEIEYTRLIINLIIPLLNTFITEDIDNYKIHILKQIEYFKIVIEALRKRFKCLNSKYFSIEEEYLFLRNFEIMLKSDDFLKTKSGLTFLRFLLYYTQKLEIKIKEINAKDFCLTNDELLKYAYKVKIIIYFRTHM